VTAEAPKANRKSRLHADGRPSTWKRIRLPVFALGALFLLTGVLYIHRRTIDTCAICISILRKDASGFGTDPFRLWTTVTASEEIRVSDTCRDFFDGKCAHRFERFSSQGGLLFFKVFDGGTLERQPMARAYDEGDRFHARVLRLMEVKLLTKEEFREACTIPAVPTDADLADPRRRALIEKGAAILLSHGDEGIGDTWKKGLERPLPPR
jgi:hypothetical protein